MPRSDIGIALKALRWLACCQRPLSLSELAVAIAIEPGAPSFDEEKKLDDDETVLTILGSLARQNVETAAVEISHFSVVEYLMARNLPDGSLNRYYINDIEGHTDLLHCCLTMLSFNAFTAMNNDCFRSYAVSQWPLHAKKSEDCPRSCTLIEIFLSNPESPAFRGWRDDWEEKFDPNLRVNMPDTHFGLYYAALFSLPRALETLLSPEALQLSGGIALLGAARDGNDEVVDLLLNANTDLGARTALGWTVLHRAVYNRHTAFVRKLLNAHIDVNVQDEDGWSALHIAISERYGEIAQLLVARGANHSTQLSESQWTPLHLAAQQGMVDVVQLLVNAGASLTQLTSFGMTPLQIAALHRQKAVFDLLAPTAVENDFEHCLNEVNKGDGIDRRIPRLSAIASTTRV